MILKAMPIVWSLILVEMLKLFIILYFTFQKYQSKAIVKSKSHYSKEPARSVQQPVCGVCQELKDILSS